MLHTFAIYNKSLVLVASNFEAYSYVSINVYIYIYIYIYTKLVTYVCNQNIKGKILLLLKQISEKYGEY
jgi:hypothetical protein